MRTVSIWNSPIWDLFDDSFTPTRRASASDVEEKETHFMLRFDLPGFTQEDVQIEAVGDELIINGKSAERGVFRRTITLPSTVDAARIEAQLEHGVLKVALPKAESAKPRKIPISVAGPPGEGTAPHGGFFSRLLGKSTEKTDAKPIDRASDCCA